MRGFNYGAEWGNNLLLGKTGDYEGFSLRANEVYSDLQHYIATYKGNKELKLWITGYSRAGTISNVLSSLILKNDAINVSQSNMFVYTFEAPFCLEESNAIKYQNVHNVINEHDLIPSIPPASFGFARCGVDYYIYDSDVGNIVTEFDQGIEIPDFVPIEVGDQEYLNDDEDLQAFILNCVFNLKSTSSTEEYTCNSREEYVDRYQPGLSYMVGNIFALSDSTRSKLLKDLSDLGFAALGVISSGENLANFVKTYLDLDNVPYEQEQLVDSCTALSNAIQYLLMRILAIYLSKTYSPSLERLLDMHYPEVTYALMLHAHKNKE